MNAISAFAKDRDSLRVVQLLGFEAEQAGNDLKVVFDPMMDLFEQRFFFRERNLELPFRGAAPL
jgi:hypothetical protein